MLLLALFLFACYKHWELPSQHQGAEYQRTLDEQARLEPDESVTQVAQARALAQQTIRNIAAEGQAFSEAQQALRDEQDRAHKT